MMKIDTSDSLSDTGKDIIQIKIIDKSVEILLSNWKVFPCLYGKFLAGEIACTDKKTLEIEEKGEQLMKLMKDSKNKKEDDCMNFCSCVIEWGGKSSVFICGKFEKNSKEEVAKCIRKSAECLENKDIKGAIEEITKLEGFDISYGSKILRMLSPQQVGVYDSILAKHLAYKNEGKDKFIDYEKFCKDCGKVVDKLNDMNVEKPKECIGGTKNGEKWRVADVEAVLFFYYYKDLGK